MADVETDMPLGTTIYGMGNNNSGNEGARWNNLIYTNCLGPLFVKNPWFAEAILKDILQQKGAPCENSISHKIAQASFRSTLSFIKQKSQQ